MAAKKVVPLILLAIVLLGAAYYTGLAPTRGGHTAPPGTQGQPGEPTTSSPTPETGSPTPGPSGAGTQGGGGEENGNQTGGPEASGGGGALPVLAANTSLEDLSRIINETLPSNGGPSYVEVNDTVAESLEGTPAYPVLEYYEYVMDENLSAILPLFDLSIVDNRSLELLHKALFERYDLVEYNISIDEASIYMVAGYIPGAEAAQTPVYAVKYVFTGTFRDNNGNMHTVSQHLATFVEESSSGYLILQTVPLEG